MLIGLTGVARAGKDSVGQVLVNSFDYFRLSLGDKIRTVALALNPIIQLDDNDNFVRLVDIVGAIGWEAAKDIPEVRQTLQRVGLDATQPFFGKTVWINLVAPENMPIHNSNFVITDVRFVHEAERITSLGGYIVKVIRPDTLACNNHVSESALDSANWPYDHILENDGSLLDLEYTVSSMLKVGF